MNDVKVYWWTARSNFGDALNPLLLERFSSLNAVWAPAVDAEMVVVGSVLESLSHEWRGYIVGAGKMYERYDFDTPDATVLALRGALSAKGVKGDYVLGDPALLVGDMVGEQNKEYDLGVVPHWSDGTLVSRFGQYNPRIILPHLDPLTVAQEIGKCKKIVSSSLHGIIIADALGVPRRAELFPRAKREGGDFKYRDYASSINLAMEFGKVQSPDRKRIEQIQGELFDLFWELPKILVF